MNRITGFALAAALAFAALPARADDVVKLTIGQRGNWDTSIAQLGTKAGIFKKHGIERRDDLHRRAAARRCSR